MENSNPRRSAMKKLTAGAAAVLLGNSLSNRLEAADRNLEIKLKGTINHSVCRWCYGSIPLEDFAKAAKEIGLNSIELLDPKDFATVQKYDLTCAMVSALVGEWGIVKGWNRPEHHAPLMELYTKLIDDTANAGFTNLICFSGNRNGLNDEQGIKNCAEGLKKIMAYAEKKKVTLVMELLNSKVDHKDYQCDHTAWGAELCRTIDSDNFKLLYDIYHMQIMEGDVVRTIRENSKYIAHYHTGGVPGRHEIDETQELYYPTIIKAIAETGFKGFVAQEFIPTRTDKLASLRQGVGICDI